MLGQENHTRRRGDYEEAGMRRNPYLVNYEEKRSRQGQARQLYGEVASGQDSAEVYVYGHDRGEIERSVRGALRQQVPSGRRTSAGGEASARRTESAEERIPFRGRLTSEKEETDLDIIGWEEPAARRRVYRGTKASMHQGKSGSHSGGESRYRTAAYIEKPLRSSGRTSGSDNSKRENAVRNYDRGTNSGRTSYREAPGHRSANGAGSRYRRSAGTVSARPSQARPAGAAGRRAGSRRKKQVMMHRLMVSVWILCIMVLGAAFAIRNYRAAAGNMQESGVGGWSGLADGIMGQQASGKSVQGLPEEVYAKHPHWEENFLTPNEYSRPGDALESVTNIFVHYTANPGTSAAQNRSYFEQQKDTHEASVSAHFIIGYDGEIIQCVPLDEIAYAVMTRNYDSVSIECCYKAQDGSFTQETYDSLISLLAWLTDAYGLDTEDILRHYDCGGKKCPLYYTEHEDAWEQLKKDVDKL